MSKHFTAIRVPLREVNAEAGIVTQIEEAIRRITNISLDSWAKLSSAFKNNPPLVILDGYDELLQASGKVFAGYLKDVQHFQKSEAEQGRPVRVVVTSRVTLIDKATVPSGATIIRLLEFDENQRERWVSIWNKANLNYFREAEIEEFALPEKSDNGAEKILALAEQPLLLLMLALYDSQDNQLRKSKGLDRTRLYDSLLRRFVTRERGKAKSFMDSAPHDKKKMLDTEMQRLGVAALGMYNRRKVHILAPELNDDLKFFNLERKVTISTGRALSEADLLLGSFFFVHKSKAQQGAGAADIHEEISAFEFLHNTFGEFLTADFILRRAVSQVEALRAFQANDALREAMEKLLNSANGFGRDWFASLVYTPLFTRPVVLEMMREWVVHILVERKLSKEDFVAGLETIVLNQIKRVLNKREMPSIICTETAQEGYRALFGDHPLLGHVAIYSINLILLRVIISDQPFIFDERKIDIHEDGARPWDRLAHIWRSWFSMDNLSGMAAAMLAHRKDSEVSIRAKPKFKVPGSQNRLETCLTVALSLGDNISSGLTGLLLFQPSKDNHLTLDSIAHRLASEKIDAEFQVTMYQMFRAERNLEKDGLQHFLHFVRSAFEMALRTDRQLELEHIAMSLRRGMAWSEARSLLGRMRRDRDNSRYWLELIDPRLIAEVAIRNPQAGLLVCQVAGGIASGEWNYRFLREFVECLFRRHDPRELFSRSPEAAVVWGAIGRQVGGWRFDDGFEGKLLHSDVLNHALDPQYLVELSESHPEAALAWVRLIRDLGESRMLETHGDEFIKRAVGGQHFPELLEQNPETALAWLQLAREVAGGRFHESLNQQLFQFHPEFFRRTLHPRYLLDLIERNPEAALIWLQLAQELGGEQFRNEFRERFDPELIMRVLGRQLFELIGRNPESLIGWVELLRQMGYQSFQERFQEITRSPDFLAAAFHVARVFLLSDSNPASALAWIRVIEELGGHDLIARRGEELFERVFDPFALAGLLRHKPATFAVALRLARFTGSSRICEVIVECLVSFLEGFGSDRSVIESLPIGALPDVKWLAEKSGNRRLRSAVRQLG